tara:strand:- start:87 stop:542 length:456 start_codon:yes stop_codon:yes gene_type:complete
VNIEVHKILLKDTVKIYILFFFYASLIFTQNIKGHYTLIINPITWKAQSPIGRNKQYRTTVELPIVKDNWQRVFINKTFKCNCYIKGSRYLCDEHNLIVVNNIKLLYLKFLFPKSSPERDMISIYNIYSYKEYEYQLLSEDKVLKEIVHSF